MADTELLDGALGGFRDMLASDGYVLSWSLTGADRVVIEVEAGDGACADCLAPLPVMRQIMSKALEPTPYELDHIVLPRSARNNTAQSSTARNAAAPDGG
jgi:hypothetical protein